VLARISGRRMVDVGVWVVRAGRDAGGGRSRWRGIIRPGNACWRGHRQGAEAVRSTFSPKFLAAAPFHPLLLGAMAEKGGCSPRDEEGSFRDGGSRCGARAWEMGPAACTRSREADDGSTFWMGGRRWECASRGEAGGGSVSGWEIDGGDARLDGRATAGARVWTGALVWMGDQRRGRASGGEDGGEHGWPGRRMKKASRVALSAGPIFLSS
jgi:hypothetical protein